MNNKLLMGWGILCNAVGSDKVIFVSHKLGTSSKLTVNFTISINEAKIFNSFYSVLDEYRKIIRHRINNIEEEELKIIKIYGGYAEINLSDDLYLNEIQKRAIKKLEKDEIAALGLERTAMFSKLDEVEKNLLKEFYPTEHISEK